MGTAQETSGRIGHTLKRSSTGDRPGKQARRPPRSRIRFPDRAERTGRARDACAHGEVARPAGSFAAGAHRCRWTVRVAVPLSNLTRSVRRGAVAVRRWSLLAVLFSSLGLLVPACGDGGSPAPTSPPATTAPATPPAPPPPEPPRLPEGATVTAYGQDFIEWSWSPIEGASGYEVQFRAHTAPTDDEDTITLAARETSYRAEGLETETVYYFRVRAFTGEGGNRTFSAWSAVEGGELGTTLDLGGPIFFLFDEGAIRDFIARANPSADDVAKLQSLREYILVSAFTDRGLPTGSYVFGCRTPESLRNQTQEWTNGLNAAVPLDFLSHATTPPDLDTRITRLRSIFGGMLDGFAARIRNGQCGVLYGDETHVWNGQHDEIHVADELQPEGVSAYPVIRILATAAALDLALEPREAELWWIWAELSSVQTEEPAVPTGVPPPPPPPLPPTMPSMDDHGDSETKATPVSVPSITSGDLQHLGDVDDFRFRLNSAVGLLVVETTGNADTYGALFGPGGEPRGQDDDSGEALNFRIDVTNAPSGTYHVAVSAASAFGGTGYLLRVSDAPQD